MNAAVYTKADLRRLLQCSGRTIERWVIAGRLPKPILPGRWSRSEVDDILRHYATSDPTTAKNSCIDLKQF